MNKKIIRIFLAVCLMLAMTSSTAFAKGAGVKNFTWYITKTDKVVHNASSTSSNAAITGKITIKRNEDPDGKPYIIEISDINIRGIKVNANEYINTFDNINKMSRKNSDFFCAQNYD